MEFATSAPGVVTLHGGGGASTADAPPPPPVDCLMCPFEPIVYDTLCDFLPPDGCRIAEVGSFKGGSACIFAQGLARRGKRGVLACHDLFEPFEHDNKTHDIEAAFDSAVAAWTRPEDRPVKVKGDSKRTHAVHQDASLDAVFVDGDHSYEGAAADIRNFWPKLKPGGFMLVQDSVREVETAVRDAAPPAAHRRVVQPPFGHYVTILCDDHAKLQRFVDALGADMTAAAHARAAAAQGDEQRMRFKQV